MKKFRYFETLLFAAVILILFAFTPTGISSKNFNSRKNEMNKNEIKEEAFTKVSVFKTE